MKAGVLFSGGKDSTYAAYLATRRDDLRCLITVMPSRDDSFMFHFPNLRWTALQARAMNLPQVAVATQGVKEDELRDLKHALSVAKSTYGIEGVYTGALASVYQKSRVDKLSGELGLEAISPLWGVDARTHYSNLIRSGFETIITGVASLGLDDKWLGRRVDAETVDELLRLQDKYGLNATLEGGEGETFVLNSPIFKAKIDVLSSEKHWNGVSGRLDIKDARLVDKL